MEQSERRDRRGRGGRKKMAGRKEIRIKGGGSQLTGGGVNVKRKGRKGGDFQE